LRRAIWLGVGINAVIDGSCKDGLTCCDQDGWFYGGCVPSSTITEGGNVVLCVIECNECFSDLYGQEFLEACCDGDYLDCDDTLAGLIGGIVLIGVGIIVFFIFVCGICPVCCYRKGEVRGGPQQQEFTAAIVTGAPVAVQYNNAGHAGKVY